jgi:hypothetical protein
MSMVTTAAHSTGGPMCMTQLTVTTATATAVVAAM